MSDSSILYELKETAKWSHNAEERRSAVSQLATKGASALPQLEEILSITAYEDIRIACAEAIRGIGAANSEHLEDPGAGDVAAESQPAKLPSTDQKKEDKEGEKESEEPLRLVDLPP